MYCFASVTGANLSSLKKIQDDKFEIVPSTKGYRTYATKKRSDGSYVPIEFSAEFVSTFNEFKSFWSAKTLGISPKYISENSYFSTGKKNARFFQIEIANSNFLAIA